MRQEPIAVKDQFKELSDAEKEEILKSGGKEVHDGINVGATLCSLFKV